jgi:hypothetical protein
MDLASEEALYQENRKFIPRNAKKTKKYINTDFFDFPKTSTIKIIDVYTNDLKKGLFNIKLI